MRRAQVDWVGTSMGGIIGMHLAAQTNTPIARLVINNTDAVHDIIMSHGSEVEQRLNKTKQPGWHDEAVGRISGISHDYRDTCATPAELNDIVDGPQAGDRAQDVLLANGSYFFTSLERLRGSVILIPAIDSTEELKN